MNVKKVAMQQLLSGKTRLPGFSGEWVEERLGDVATFVKGRGLSKADISRDGTKPCIHYGELFRNYGERITNVMHGTDLEGDFVYSATNDVLMPTSDVTPNGLATASCIQQSGIILGGGILVIRIPEDVIDGVFLAYSIRHHRNQIMGLVTGTTVYHLYGHDMAKFSFPVPNLEEQRAIAEALSDVDGLIKSLEALIAKKRAVKAAAMQQLLTGKTRLPGFRGEWETKQLVELGVFSKGRGIKRSDVRDEGHPCIRYGELYTRYSDFVATPVARIPASVALAAQPIENGDLLFAGAGETPDEIGRCVAYVGENTAYAGGDIIILSPFRHASNSLYLGYLLNHPTVSVQKARLAQGDAIVHISSRSLGQVRITLPDVEEQTAIVAILSGMDAEITAIENRLDKVRSIKHGMMQQLLTGRIRLPATDGLAKGQAESAEGEPVDAAPKSGGEP